MKKFSIYSDKLGKAITLEICKGGIALDNHPMSKVYNYWTNGGWTKSDKDGGSWTNGGWSKSDKDGGSWTNGGWSKGSGSWINGGWTKSDKDGGSWTNGGWSKDSK